MIRFRVFCAILVLCIAATAGASPDQLFQIADLNTEPASSKPYLQSLGDRFVLNAVTRDYGAELWALDKDMNLQLIVDARPGPPYGTAIFEFQTHQESYHKFKSIGGKYYFQAYVDKFNWVATTGTPGDYEVLPIYASHSPDALIGEIQGKALIGDQEYISGRNFFISDGTNAGTTILMALASDEFYSTKHNYTVNLSGWGYFTTKQGGEIHLYKSDGTPANTSRLMSFTESDYPALFGFGNSIYIMFPASGRYYKSNGTAAGTELIQDYDGSIYHPVHAVEWNGALYYEAPNGSGAQLVKTDGSVTESIVASFIQDSDKILDLRAGVNNRLFLIAGDYGTPHQVASVAGDDSVSSDTFFSVQYSYAAASAGDRMYYLDAGNTYIYEWDGVNAETEHYLQIDGEPVEGIFRMESFDNKLIISADSGDGQEPHVWDPSTGEARQIADMRPGTNGCNPGRMFPLNQKVILSALVDQYTNLYAIEDPASGPVFIDRISDSSLGFAREFSMLDGQCYFLSAGNGSGAEQIFRTDGSSVELILTFQSDLREAELCAAGGNLYVSQLSLSDNTGNLFKVDISEKTLIPLNSTPWLRSFPTVPVRMLQAVNGKLLFVGRSADGDQLYISDGTEAGTKVVKDLGSGNDIVDLAVTNSGAYYFINNGSNCVLRWTAGTASSDIWIKTFDKPRFSYRGEVAVDNRLWFAADSVSEGAELWISDGAPSTTLNVANLGYLGHQGSPHSLTPFQGGLFFGGTLVPEAADTFGSEPYFTYGSEETTRMVADLTPGVYGSMTGGAVSALERIFFIADTPGWGKELWEWEGGQHYPERKTGLWSDGAVFDNGSLVENPLNAAELQNSLIFAADDGWTGAELWALIPSTSAREWNRYR